jgi:hypothetical protein
MRRRTTGRCRAVRGGPAGLALSPSGAMLIAD